MKYKSIFQIRPLTDKAKNWVFENMRLDQIMGESIICESRYVDDIIDGMIEAGLKPKEDFIVS